MSPTPPAASPRPLEIPPPIGEPRIDALRQLLAIVDRLRAEDGCPWDREQTTASVAPHLVEEAHEVLEAVESKTDADVVEEAGDLLMGICLLARIAEQAQRFSLADVATAVNHKLVRRHPHVFGDTRVDSAEQALTNWERIKREERQDKRADASAIAGVPAAMPALQRAHRLGDKARSAGFRWRSASDALDKVGEELSELCAAFESAQGTGEIRDATAEQRERLEAELGDLLLSAALLGGYVGIDPERAARGALRRFEERFRAMESDLGGQFAGRSLSEMQLAWERAKTRHP